MDSTNRSNSVQVVNTGDRVCGNEDFNSLASTADECIPCFCFGVTSQCSSAEMYHSSLPPPQGTFNLVSVDFSGGRTARVGPGLLSPTFVSAVAGGQKVYLSERSPLGPATPYFSLPSSHTGRQLNSYGGYLRFKTSYTGQGSPVRTPIVVITVTTVTNIK